MYKSVPSDARLYALPLSPGYWRTAAATLRSTKMLVFTALCIALNIVLSFYKIPLGDNLNVLPSYFANATFGMVCGPVMAVPYGIAKDLIGYMMYPDGGFFPGYTLTSVLGAMVYALAFFRARVTVARVVVAKLVNNYLINVLLGSFWSSVLYSKGYYYYLIKSLVKNTILLPVEILMLVVLFTALVPIITRMGFMPAVPMVEHHFRFRGKERCFRTLSFF